MYEIVGRLFNTCYRSFYQDRKYFLDINAVGNKKTIGNFINRLKKIYDINSIGEYWLRHYFRFQFSYWLDKKTNRQITLQWILGNKALQRYQSIDNWEQVNYHIEKNTSFIVFEDRVRQQDQTRQNEERKRYLNKDIGLLWCIDYTTLYINGPVCIRCKFKKQCKELLQMNYPKLYKQRCMQ